MLVNIWVKDNLSGYVHQFGTDEHDSLEVIDGKVEYINIQCMAGTYGGEYSFIETVDMDEYISLTPEQLCLNRELIHKDLLNALKEKK